MLPPEFKTDELEEIQKQIDADPEAFLTFEKPTLSDIQLFGTYVVYLNYIELNIRRSIEIFSDAGKLSAEQKKKRHRMSAKYANDLIQEIVKGRGYPNEIVAECLKNLNEIEYARSMRNLIAHWAVRRLPGKDFYVFMTRSASDAKQALSEEIESAAVATAIIPAAQLKGFCQYVGTLEVWIANKVPEWAKEYKAHLNPDIRI